MRYVMRLWHRTNPEYTRIDSGISSVRVFFFLIFLALFVVLCSPHSLRAETEYIYPVTDRSIEFFSGGPGARASGLGGAFIAVADDASALEWNPAGMSTVHRMQIFIELRSYNYAIPGFEDERFIDTEDTSSSFSPNLGLIWPLHNGRFGVGLFHSATWSHEWEWHRENQDRNNPKTYWFDSMRNTSELDVYNFDIGCSYEFSPGFSLGGTARFHSMTKKYSFYAHGDQPGFKGGELEVPAQGSVEVEVETSASAVSGIIGIMLKPLNKFSIGLVGKSQASFTYSEIGFDGLVKEETITLPTVIGLGLAYDATDNFKISLDLDYVMYSEIGQDVQSDQEGNPLLISPDDAIEYHLGMEYVFSQPVGNNFYVGFRAGFYNRAPHYAYYEENENIPGGDPDRGIAELFPYVEEDEQHITFGMSGRVKRFQADLGADISDENQAVSVTLKTILF